MLAKKYPTMLFVVIIAFVAFALKSSETDTTSHQVPSRSENLSYEQFRVEMNEYLSVVASQGPGSALNKLKTAIHDSEPISYYCHELLHEIGRASYDKFSDLSKALYHQDEVCVSGYVHGVMEGYLQDVTDVSDALKTACILDHENPNTQWQCYHGIGHGLMFFSQNDLPHSIERCGIFDAQHDRTACTNGVFMENFNADQKKHPSRYTQKDDPFYPCGLQREEDKYGCYMNVPIYMLRLNNNDYASALTWCDDAEKNYRSACYYGVGSQSTRRNVDEIEYIESICMSGGSSRSEPCMSGMLVMHISIHDSLEAGKDMCKHLNANNAVACLAETETLADFFIQT